MTPERRPIFVTGAPRSGTTLVSNILGRHPAVQAAGETHFFEDIWAGRGKFRELTKQGELEAAVSRLLTVFGRFNQLEGQALVDRLVRPQALVERALQNGGGCAGLYLAFTGSLNQSGRRLRYCDDTPKHLFYLNTILEFFPEARIIICVRDPRDFLCSYKNFWRTSRDPRRIQALYHPIITALLWRSSAGVVLNNPLARQPDKVMILHYEALVAEPAAWVKKLCAFTGLDDDDRMAKVGGHNSAFEQAGAGIYQGSVGRWVNCLTAEEVWWAQRLNGREMARLGYETAALAVSPVKASGILLSVPAALWRALRANSGRRGPLVNYVMRRMLSRKAAG